MDVNRRQKDPMGTSAEYTRYRDRDRILDFCQLSIDRVKYKYTRRKEYLYKSREG